VVDPHHQVVVDLVVAAVEAVAVVDPDFLVVRFFWIINCIKNAKF
jgi:hypothetical protein